MTRPHAARSVVGLAATAALANLAVARDFHGLGILPDAPFSNRVVAMSADGHRVVVGGSTSAAIPQVLLSSVWTSPGGYTGLQFFPGAGTTRAGGISADGAFVTGVSGSEVVRWSSADGSIALDYGTTTTYPGARVSGDGSAIAGAGRVGNFDQAYRWTPPLGVQTIHSVNTLNEAVTGISETGNVVIGTSGFPQGEHQRQEGWVWTPGGGAAALQGDYLRRLPQIIAPDATFVIGAYTDNNAYPSLFALVRWDLAGHATVLSGPDSASNKSTFVATGVTNACDLIVGSQTGSGGPLAWTPDGGFVTLASYFGAHGVDFTGWSLTSVSALTPDGLTFAGAGVNPSGQTEAWIATIPAPGSLAMAGLATACAIRRRR